MNVDLVSALALVLKSEGGFVNNPNDPGGATNYGVTQAVYNAYRVGKGLKPAAVKFIAMADVVAIYRFQYWNQVRGDELPAGVDYVLFDEAVNSGPVKSVIDLQTALGFKGKDVDGHLGLMTLSALGKVRDDNVLIDRICDLRLNWLHRLRTWRVFGKGWASRVAAVRASGHRMVASPALARAA